MIGPPAAGKSTYIREHMTDGDIVIDYDILANALSGRDLANHQHTRAVKQVTKAARDAAITTARTHADTIDVWIIHSTPAQSTIDQYQDDGAEVIVIDPGKDTVMHRVKHQRPAHLLPVAAKWYDQQAASKRPRSTTERGYGHRHQTIRRRLLHNHTDGTPCDWCGQPMYRDAKRNFDHAPLEADHTNDLKHHGHGDADRLLHRRCNRQRKDGQEHRRPGAPSTPTPRVDGPPAVTPFEWG
ncbi:ATP-binding protein [Corynebacterium kalidii]|uniref:ATP-binding protein n=1 Tax=Corynebacterium kalidii TaxID=2931982 RepID=A0A9X2B2M8_9CORY|nr:ATP-binding protein [Corynebacterium kalidii]